MMRRLISIGAIAIVLSGSTVEAGKRLRRAQTYCPPSNPSVACTTLFDPVDCGGGCIYGNSCLSGAAGFLAANCPPVGGSVCPIPAAGEPACPATINRLSCGTHGCIYDNDCFAQRANFPLTDCVPSTAAIACPAIPSNVGNYCLLAPQFLQPVICSGCQYPSDCIATQAGMVNCFPGGTGGGTPGTVGPTGTGTTLPPVTGTPPPLGTLPAVTGGPVVVPLPTMMPCDPATTPGCLQVEEATAGPDDGTEGPTMDVTPDMTSSPSVISSGGIRRAQTYCPPPDTSIACTLVFDPVDCGGGCVYSNPCLSAAAGNKNCPAAAGSSCPIPAEGDCPSTTNPLSCGIHGCLYDNECYAQRANFPLTDCVPSTAPIVCPPVPDYAGVKCLATLFVPVVCSGCQYQSVCHANAAGMFNCYEGGTGTGSPAGTGTTLPPVTGTGTPLPPVGTLPPLTGGPVPLPTMMPCDPASTLGCLQVEEATVGPDDGTVGPSMDVTPVDTSAPSM
jgi:hypothetical protein